MCVHICIQIYTFLLIQFKIEVFIYMYMCVYVYSIWHPQYQMLRVWHDSFICVTCLMHMCDVTHTYVGHNVYPCITWRYIRVACLIHLCDMTLHLCDLTHTHGGYDIFTCVTRFIRIYAVFSAQRRNTTGETRLDSMRDRTASWHDWLIWQDWCIRGTWRIHMCGMIRSRAWHYQFSAIMCWTGVTNWTLPVQHIMAQYLGITMTRVYSCVCVWHD